MSLPTEPRDLLRLGLEQLGAPDPAAAASLLDRYLDELERWNARFGLVGPSDRRDLVVRHVLDSLAPWKLIESLAAGAPILDVGSGAGFPGIPLAILLSGFPITLLERSRRRSLFLKTCAVLLGLPCVTVLQSQLSEAAGIGAAGGAAGVTAAGAPPAGTTAAAARATRASSAGTFAVVTFRAVAPLDRFVAELERSSLEARAIVAYKGKLQRAREEVAAVQRVCAGGLGAEVVPLSVPFLDEERCVVVLRRPMLTNR